MPAGGPGDHPLTDILNFNLEVYNTECDNLVREISKYISIDRLYEMFEWFDNFRVSDRQLKEFEITLTKKLSELKYDAQQNGWATKK